jgi:hypothetical protein
MGLFVVYLLYLARACARACRVTQEVFGKDALDAEDERLRKLEHGQTLRVPMMAMDHSPRDDDGGGDDDDDDEGDQQDSIGFVATDSGYLAVRHNGPTADELDAAYEKRRREAQDWWRAPAPAPEKGGRGKFLKIKKFPDTHFDADEAARRSDELYEQRRAALENAWRTK